MNTALVTAIGSFSADIVIRNLKKMNFRVIGCDIYPREWIANTMLVDDFRQAPYASDTDRYQEFIQQLCLCEQIRYVLPLTDVEVDVLNRSRNWFEQNSVTLCLSPYDTIMLCRNKREMALFTQGLDFLNSIPTFASREEIVLSHAPFGTFPLICKPIDGRSSQGICRIHSELEWRNFCSIHDMRQYIVQPCIPGSVVTVDIVRQSDGKKTIAIPRQEMLRTQNGAGTSVYVYTDQALQRLCCALADALRIVGCVNFEFIKDQMGSYHFIECNPRFSGGVAFSCAVGYDCVSNHLAAFDGRKIDDLHPYHNQYIVKKYHEHITCVEG